jgi:phosphate starvation-inducible protein PhoH
MNEKQLARKQKKLTARKDQRIIPDNSLKLRDIAPLTVNQSRAYQSFDKGTHLALHGTAGTGKSFVSLFLGLRAVQDRDFHKVYIVRSAVPTRDMGFMPGNDKEKSKLYEAPYKQICTELYGRGDAYEVLKHKDIVEFVTTSYIRGITLDNCVIVVDETQNCTYQELSSIITRMGTNSRIIFCGDTKQTDFLPNRQSSGIVKFSKVIERIKEFTCIRFNYDDIVRSDIVKRFIIAEEDIESQENS